MPKTTSIAFLVIAMLFWAVNFHVVKYTLEFYSPMAAAEVRFFFASLFLVIYLLLKNGNAVFQLRLSKMEMLHIFFVSFFGVFLSIFFFNKGLLLTDAINGSLIETTNPIIVAIFSFLFLKVKLSIRQSLAILISILGVIVVLAEGDLKIYYCFVLISEMVI